jgi:hypothetical protein
MKSLLITAAAAIILCGNVSAQGSFFMLGFGYGFPTGDLLGVTQSDYIEKNVYGSFARGLTIGGNIGYMVNNSIGLDLGLWYVSGSTYDFTLFNSNGNSIHLVSGNTFRITPCIKVTGGNSNNLYARFGPVLGIGTVLKDDETLIPSSGGVTIYPIHKFTGGFANGWTGAFGIDVSENKKASVFIEINFYYQMFKPDLEIINVPGQSAVTYNLVDDPNPAAPNVKLKPTFSFSTIGLTAGIKFSSSTNKKNATSIQGDK